MYVEVPEKDWQEKEREQSKSEVERMVLQMLFFSFLMAIGVICASDSPLIEDTLKTR